MTQQQHESKFTPIKYRWIKSVLTILIIILLAMVTVIGRCIGGDPAGGRYSYTWGTPNSLSGRRSGSSGACKIGAAGAPGNWTGMLWQEWYFFRRFPGGRRH